MNKQLQLKRDELNPHYLINDYEEELMSEGFDEGFDAAIDAVIELLGQHDDAALEAGYEYAKENGAVGSVEKNFVMNDFASGARWQHSEMMKKLKGDV